MPIFLLILTTIDIIGFTMFRKLFQKLLCLRDLFGIFIHPECEKPNNERFQFDPETVEERATSWIPLNFLFIYVFI